MKNIITFLFFLSALPALSQKKPVDSLRIDIVSQETKSSLRGLSVVNDKVVWASGSQGTVGRSNDGGTTWEWIVVKGFETRDFRDIEAFDGLTALIMAVDAPAYILKTVDGGQSWKVVYENNTAGMFLDAMEFWNERAGIVLGDPIEGKFFIVRTFDGGSTWQEVPQQFRPDAEKGEACFAASGTNVRVLDRDEAVFISGGTRSRIFIRDEVIDLPIIQGTETTGANSVAVMDPGSLKGGKSMIVVGGDFNARDSREKNCFFTTDRGKTWKAPKNPPHGYRSCVEYLSKRHLVSCGLNGVDYSSDGGNNWKWISKEGFHVCRKAKQGNAVFFAGSNGRVGKMVFPE
jgi:photosystem II stability/assembly factor-like uncharacterized protein